MIIKANSEKMNVEKDKEETSTHGTQFKLKSNLMNKFFNEPVDALDLRLANAEENLSSLPVDPFTDIKQEEEEKQSFCIDEHPLDCSEVQVATPAPTYLDERIESPTYNNGDEVFNEKDIPPLVYKESMKHSENTFKDIQRVTLRASSSSHTLSPSSYQQDPSGWRISPIPWRNLIAPSQQDLYPDEPASDSRFHGQLGDYRMPQYHFENRNGMPPRYEAHANKIYIEPRPSPTNLTQGTYYSDRAPVNNSQNLIPDRINVIDYGRENFQHKRLHDQVPMLDRDFPPAKRFKRFADTEDIDRRISLAESIGNENPLFSNREINNDINRSFHQKYEDKNSLWRKNFPAEKLPVQPSLKYMNRYQELMGERPENGRLHHQITDSNHHETPKSQVQQPTNASSSDIKPQRMNSVIVRNTSGMPKNMLPNQGLQQRPNEAIQPTLKEDAEKYIPKYFPQSEPPHFPPDSGLMDRNWLKKLQHLRAGFAYKMMEAQRQQGFGQHPYHPPDFNPNSTFSNHPSRKFNNDIPLPENFTGHPHQHSKPVNEGSYHLAQNVKTETAQIVPKPEQIYKCSSTITSNNTGVNRSAMKGSEKSPQSAEYANNQSVDNSIISSNLSGKGKRGRPRKHAPKLPLPPLYVFIRNLLHNTAYNPSVVSWVDDDGGCFKVTNTLDFAKTWGRMKSNRSEEMNYEKMSRAMRYHYGCERQGRKGHLAMVKEKRLYYRFGELAKNWRSSEVANISSVSCTTHNLCKNNMCLWTKE
eukprot:GFUD01003544.1.p1 GENE.GFUD01003544.1~~GFUD01003544.1.p1  ORF type:complete len:756 (+),score=122.33 GFUD01003544.1:496-2763(+)